MGVGGKGAPDLKEVAIVGKPSKDSCEKYCLGDSDATGCEFNDEEQKCHSHTDPLDTIQFQRRSGYHCLVFSEKRFSKNP